MSEKLGSDFRDLNKQFGSYVYYREGLIQLNNSTTQLLDDLTRSVIGSKIQVAIVNLQFSAFAQQEGELLSNSSGKILNPQSAI